MVGTTTLVGVVGGGANEVLVRGVTKHNNRLMKLMSRGPVEERKLVDGGRELVAGREVVAAG